MLCTVIYQYLHIGYGCIDCPSIFLLKQQTFSLKIIRRAEVKLNLNYIEVV